MGIRKFKPVTPGTRFRAQNTYEELTPDYKVEKSLIVSLKNSGGRNNSGKMTMRYIGGGYRKLYRVIDFKRNKFGVEAKVDSIQYDPNRSCFIALLVYTDGEKRYIIAPKGLDAGQTVVSGTGIAPEIGNALPLSEIPLGTTIHNIELHPGKGGQLVRSAGSAAQLLNRDGKYATVKMASGETRQILVTCYATVGQVSNPDHMNEVKGKAGANRWIGRRPRTRPVAMNPIDHPMGGGEGRASGGHPRSRKGLKSKGYKTRTPKKYSNSFIIESRKKK
ncbi:MAG: 50S ribosomal protein L2 [Bacteroidia bacterium]|nr:50S ribosomal protein L2 [Bacteroidia bacterium]MCF8427817.1 50S ribosomal protein L2 [Bacteroidia bacterium]MCF8446055.1 50S ribosomal protein L2 [Bacteroidia bacterium]